MSVLFRLWEELERGRERDKERERERVKIKERGRDYIRDYYC